MRQRCLVSIFQLLSRIGHVVEVVGNVDELAVAV